MAKQGFDASEGTDTEANDQFFREMYLEQTAVERENRFTALVLEAVALVDDLEAYPFQVGNQILGLLDLVQPFVSGEKIDEFYLSADYQYDIAERERVVGALKSLADALATKKQERAANGEPAVQIEKMQRAMVDRLDTILRKGRYVYEVYQRTAEERRAPSRSNTGINGPSVLKATIDAMGAMGQAAEPQSPLQRRVINSLDGFAGSDRVPENRSPLSRSGDDEEDHRWEARMASLEITNPRAAADRRLAKSREEDRRARAHRYDAAVERAGQRYRLVSDPNNTFAPEK